MNPRPKAYESSALPLSYSGMGNGVIAGREILCAAPDAKQFFYRRAFERLPGGAFAGVRTGRRGEERVGLAAGFFAGFNFCFTFFGGADLAVGALDLTCLRTGAGALLGNGRGAGLALMGLATGRGFAGLGAGGLRKYFQTSRKESAKSRGRSAIQRLMWSGLKKAPHSSSS